MVLLIAAQLSLAARISRIGTEDLRQRWSGARRCELEKLESTTELFSLWKDADPDIPILKEARAEYAKLK